MKHALRRLGPLLVILGLAIGIPARARAVAYPYIDFLPIANYTGQQNGPLFASFPPDHLEMVLTVISNPNNVQLKVELLEQFPDSAPDGTPGAFPVAETPNMTLGANTYALMDVGDGVNPTRPLSNASYDFGWPVTLSMQFIPIVVPSDNTHSVQYGLFGYVK